MKLQKRGYLTFFTYFNQEKEYIWLWNLKIDNQNYYGKTIEEFIFFLNNLKFSITIWNWGFSSKNFIFIKNELIKQKFKYYSIFDKTPKIKRNMWKIFFSTKLEVLNLDFYNKNLKKIVFLCGKKTINFTLNEWAEYFKINIETNKIIYLKEFYFTQKNGFNNENKEIKDWIIDNKIPKNHIKNINNHTLVLEKGIELNLKILGYEGRKYLTTLNQNGRWYWKKNSLIDIDNFFNNKIQSYDLWNKLYSCLNGNYKYKHQNIENNNYSSYDQKSAFIYQMLKNDMPTIEIKECDKNDCKCDLSILSITYYNFKLKNKKLPVIKNEFGKLLKSGEEINYSTILQEHQKIQENYEYSYLQINWKYCSLKASDVFNHHFEHFFILKEVNKNNILGKLGKSYLINFWGGNFLINPVKNNYYYDEKNNKVELINKKNDVKKNFNSKKCQFIPVPIFLLAYQRLEMIKIGEANYDNLIEINIDEIKIKGENLIIPKNEWINKPHWAKKYNLGKWIKN